jgi:hypothetical protein
MLRNVETNKKRGSTPLSFANNTTNKGVLQQRYDYIPIDFIKAQLVGLSEEHFLNNIGLGVGKFLKYNGLVFTPVFEKETSDTVKYWYNEFENFKLKIYESGGIYFSGSLHKFYNNGLHNHNEFNQSAYTETLERIKSVYGIEPQSIRIIQIEYGVNIKPPINTNDILYNLLQHKNKDFEQKISNDKGDYLQCEHSQYIIKVYNKAKQYKLIDEVLRIEIKQTNWSEYRKKGIRTLKDFNDTNKLQFLDYLLGKWNEIVFYDPTNKNVDKWIKYSNINFWRSIKTISDKNKSKHKNRLKELNKSNGLDIQNRIHNEIIKTVNLLQGVRNFNFNKNQRVCKLTGVNISMQRNDSFLLSHSGLYYLLQNDKKNFERIKSMFLNRNWFTSSIEKQIKEIAHNIRTKYTYRKRKHKGQQLIMFKPLEGKELQLYI